MDSVVSLDTRLADAVELILEEKEEKSSNYQRSKDVRTSGRRGFTNAHQ